MNLRRISTEALEAELARRKSASLRPDVVDNIDWSPLKRMIIDAVDNLVETGSYGDDFEHYVYEEAMKCVFGNGYFEWRNDLMR